MRKLVFGINISIDGCCDHTKMMANEEVHDYFTQLMRSADTIVYGRKTYELMVPFWPDVAKNPVPQKSLNDFAEAFSANHRVVFSTTLESVDERTTLIRGNLKEEILKLKQQPGGNISTGGVDLTSQLIELDLVDEFHFVVHPIIVGEGRRLFDTANLPVGLNLKLVETKHFKSGGVALRYARG